MFSGRWVLAMAMAYPKLSAAMLCGQIVANHVTPAPGWQMPGNTVHRVHIYIYIYALIYTYRFGRGVSGVEGSTHNFAVALPRPLLSFHFA